MDDLRGFDLWLDREAWGVVTDALIEHAQSAENRKVQNPASNSDERAEMCRYLIGVINDRDELHHG